MSDTLLDEVTKYFPNVLVNIIVNYTRCEECYKFQKKLKTLTAPYFVRSESERFYLNFMIRSNDTIDFTHEYYNLYGDRYLEFVTTVEYLSMLLAHNLDYTHLLSHKQKYDHNNMDQHFTLPAKPIISPHSFNTLMINLKNDL